MTKDDYAHKDLTGAQVVWAKRLEKALADMDMMEFVPDQMERDGDWLQWIKIDFRGGGVGEFMVIAKILGRDGGPYVAFEGAASPVMALAKMLRKLRDGEVKWREDKFHGSNTKT